MEEDLNLKTKEELVTLGNSLKAEVTKIKKKNQKLEEGYIKLNSDLKNLKSDRQQLENFVKIILPKENQDNYIHSEFGMYDSDELKKLWMISETQKENEFQKILSSSKMEKIELLEKLNSTDNELATKSNELVQIRKTLEEIQNQLNFYVSNFKSAQKKYQDLENEKTYLVGIIDSKTNEIERLHHIELEVAEMKAQQLLLSNGLDDDYEDDYSSFKKSPSLIKREILA